ncbi:heterokaryon incompatibility protein-domain-containing protein [Paraphoma chrysanthemicola]|uniref:Heterokaryon incompatibility protein-domain-containing protein n=1 Tax=Paraphoma chrysanthemicola TaxID=798071 RepID=A0A8K0RL33_9PLEO|nr:heterokaryon incompatibility protein-domain-containing protein [Paraphoma chrysanthemicola]
METVDTAERPIFDRLCSVCTTIFDGTSDRCYPRRHLNMRSLFASAKQGCHMCSLMLAELGVDVAKHLQHDLEALRFHPEDPITISFQPLQFDRGLDIQALCPGRPPTNAFHYFPDAAGHFNIGNLFCATRETGFQLHNRSSSMSNYHTKTAEQIKNWLEECDGKHSECRNMQAVTAMRPILPSRLLDLNGVPYNGQFRLVSTHGFPEDTVYATLSHCWGGQCALRLTTSNRHMLQEGFAAEHLPQTFRDSISVAIDLGIRYLWIDALCIIQDSVNDADWLFEAAIMGDVYANSYITIAASSSPNSTAGLFHRRNPLVLWPCGVTADLGHPNMDVSDLVVGSFCWGQSHHFQPLTNRAWAYQEWALSKRLVHFCHDQIRWECFCLTACEVYPGECKNTKGQRSVKGTIAALSKLSIGEAALGDNNHYLWNEIRANYSRQILTRPSDRLIAFSGIARVVHRLLGRSPQDYFAGHWKPGLLKELLWTSESDESQARNLSPYIAPTWSWASHCPVSMSHSLISREYFYHAKVLEATTVPVDDVFGALQSAKLLLRCKICVVTLVPGMALAYQKGRECHVTSINGSPARCNGRLFEDCATTAPNSREVPRSFCYIPITTEHISPDKSIYGLLVERVPDSGNQYARIGMLAIDLELWLYLDPEPRRVAELLEISLAEDLEAGSQDEEGVGTQVIELI